MDIDSLMAKIDEYLPTDKQGLIKAAYEFAAQAHKGQVRKSGEPYLEHPLQVAMALANLHLDRDTLIAALLHDIPEDCDISLDDIEIKFGSEVAKLVDGVTKLKKLTNRSGQGWRKSRVRAENLRKMLVATVEDLRVIIIKLADRLHNMRTLGALPLSKRRAIAQETLEVYAPLAHRLGMWDVKWQLEDLGLRYLEPQQYRRISRLVAEKREQREKFIVEASQTLRQELDKAGMEAKVFGRPKHIYSIYQKLNKYAAQGKDFGDIHDLFALRVLVDSVSDCYKILGTIHNLWHPMIEEFNDFIANPKDNGYQSLHTTVLCQGTTPLEIQIRTYHMHQIAEHGVAAHWHYKGGGDIDLSFGHKIPWLRDISQLREEFDGEEFLESVKTDIFGDRVFVYTPQGDIKDLPKGATPLDFAFRIHTDLGYGCIGARVNGRLVSLNYILGNGDIVEIIAAKGRKGPSLDWLNPQLNYVKTSHARGKIRQWFNKQERGQSVDEGKELLNRELKRLGISLPSIDKLAHQFKYKHADDFFAALGRGGITLSQISLKLSLDLESPGDTIGISAPRKGSPSSVKVLGVGDLFTRLAGCCHPLPGDEIIGYITQGRGITVHRKDCPNIINEVEKERLIDVSWGDVGQVYPVTIKIDAWDRVGLVRDISAIISEEGVNITGANVNHHDNNVTSLYFALEIKSATHLNKVVSRIYSLWNVINVVREGGSDAK
ncbi:MAG: bifunctional (p)ppGpp synthetase/guanosine-3',5'-bis(diphosphate) 3'-pyrophosphohydrolase [Dehalococcoidia bacterium]|nr:bifunctional (p)ppGpp synthetase/guanosine-3',5'-bis(diphosphate) 3'-pyrophosphohydrolase [Dehalococcoidia bacterium]